MFRSTAIERAEIISKANTTKIFSITDKNRYLELLREEYGYEFVCGLDRGYQPPHVEAVFGPCAALPFKEKNRQHWFFKDPNVCTAFRCFVNSNGTREQLRDRAAKAKPQLTLKRIYMPEDEQPR